MDPRQVLADGLGDFFNDGLFSGVGSMGVWRQKFTRMRALLEFAYASEEEKAIFAAAIQSAIIDAPDTELSVEERRALSDTVATVFDGNPKPIAADVAPRALFLRHMRIWPTPQETGATAAGRAHQEICDRRTVLAALQIPPQGSNLRLIVATDTNGLVKSHYRGDTFSSPL